MAGPSTAVVLPVAGPLGVPIQTRVSPEVLGKHIYINNKQYRLLRPGAPLYKSSRVSFESLSAIGFTLNDTTIFGRELDAPLPNGDTYGDFLFVLFSAEDKELKPINKELLQKLADDLRSRGFLVPPDNRQRVVLDNGVEVRIPVFPEATNTTYAKKQSITKADASGGLTPMASDKPPRTKVHKIRSIPAVMKDVDNYFKTGLLTAVLMQPGLENHDETKSILKTGGALQVDASAAAAPAAAPAVTKPSKKAKKTTTEDPVQTYVPFPTPAAVQAPVPAVVPEPPIVVSSAPTAGAGRSMDDIAFSELIALAFRAQRNNVAVGSRLLSFIDNHLA